MATWEFNLTGLRVEGIDAQGWPITALVPLAMQLDEDNIMRLFATARAHALEQFPDCCAVQIDAFDRIDKATTKDYGAIPNPPSLQYPLDPRQQAMLVAIKEAILTEVLGRPVLAPGAPYAHHEGGTIYQIGGEAAWIWDQDRIADHAEAWALLTALERFYRQITPHDLRILQTAATALTHEELALVRAYAIAHR